jgi:hypothetical protein
MRQLEAPLVGLSYELNAVTVRMVLEQANEAFGVDRTTTVDPPRIAAIVLFEREITVGVEGHSGDVASREPRRVRGDLELVRPHHSKSQRPVGAPPWLIARTDSGDVERYVIGARPAGEKRFSGYVCDLHPHPD